jgi:hypothetical protein
MGDMTGAWVSSFPLPHLVLDGKAWRPDTPPFLCACCCYREFKRNSMCERKTAALGGKIRYCNEKRLCGKNMEFSKGPRTPPSFEKNVS